MGVQNRLGENWVVSFWLAFETNKGGFTRCKMVQGCCEWDPSMWLTQLLRSFVFQLLCEKELQENDTYTNAAFAFPTSLALCLQACMWFPNSKLKHTHTHTRARTHAHCLFFFVFFFFLQRASVGDSSQASRVKEILMDAPTGDPQGVMGLRTARPY